MEGKSPATAPPAHGSHRNGNFPTPITDTPNRMPKLGFESLDLTKKNEPMPIDFSRKPSSGHHSPHSSEEFNGHSEPKKPKLDVPTYLHTGIDAYLAPYSNIPLTQPKRLCWEDFRLVMRESPSALGHRDSYVPSMLVDHQSYHRASDASVFPLPLPPGYRSSCVSPLERSPLSTEAVLQVTTTTPPVRPSPPVSIKKNSHDRPFKHADQIINSTKTTYFVEQNMPLFVAGRGSSPVSVSMDGFNAERREVGEEKAPESVPGSGGSSSQGDSNQQTVSEHSSSPGNQNPVDGVQTNDIVKTAGRRKGKPVPEDQKDEAYRIRRMKNNKAAKDSRDRRKKKEDALAVAAFQLKTTSETLEDRCRILTLQLSKKDDELRRMMNRNLELERIIAHMRMTDSIMAHRQYGST